MRSTIPLIDCWSMRRILNDEECYQIVEDSLWGGEEGDMNESLLVSSRSVISESVVEGSMEGIHYYLPKGKESPNDEDENDAGVQEEIQKQ